MSFKDWIIKNNLFFKVVVGWSLMISVLLCWNVYENHDAISKYAVTEARAIWKKDVIFRHWNAEHGGLYATIDKNTQPNPYLEMPERDITTSHGKKLTLLNPAYMTRQLYEIAKKEYGIEEHITSLRPIRPQNTPDKWEKKALRAFEHGEKEYFSVVKEDTKSYLRYMRPLITEKRCLACHAKQNYKIGDVRGGISIKIPLSEYLSMFYQHIAIDFLAYFIIWAIGVLGIFYASNRIRDDIERIRSQNNQMVAIYECLERLKLGILIVDKNYKVKFMNKIMIHWFGNQVGKVCYESISGISSPCPSCQKHGVIEHNKDINFKTVLPDGRIFEVSASPIKYPDGSVAKFEVVKDVTEQKKIEEEQLKIQKMESISLLAGGIAHDFNNLLAGLLGNMELAQLKLSPEHPAYVFVDTSVRTLEKASKLTNQLLTFSKGGAPVLEVVDLRSFIKETVEFSLTGSNVKAHFDLSEDLWPVNADKEQISQVISNLTINAKQAMPKGGNLYISAKNVSNCKPSPNHIEYSNFVKITIRDEGVGIPPKYLDRIFEPYFTTKRTGSGLGLATSYNIIQRHNGYIKVYSDPEIGTSFIIYLPANNREKVGSSNINQSHLSLKKNNSGHILIVDDEKIVRDAIGNMLVTLGYTYETAVDGREALEKYKSALDKGKPYDVVLMDLTIPGGMGGEEAIRIFLEIDSNAKVIAVSGYSDSDIIANYHNYGFIGKLTKPFRIENLHRILIDNLA